MVVMTPTFPTINSTHNVSKSRIGLITEHFKEGSDLTLKIFKKEESWASLFTPYDFFGSFKVFIQVDYSSSTEDEFKIWSGFVQSKLRMLITDLERLHSNIITAAIPFSRTFNNPIQNTPHNAHSFIGLRIDKQRLKTLQCREVNLKNAISRFEMVLKSSPSYRAPQNDDSIPFCTFSINSTNKSVSLSFLSSPPSLFSSEPSFLSELSPQTFDFHYSELWSFGKTIEKNFPRFWG